MVGCLKYRQISRLHGCDLHYLYTPYLVLQHFIVHVPTFNIFDALGLLISCLLFLAFPFSGFYICQNQGFQPELFPPPPLLQLLSCWTVVPQYCSRLPVPFKVISIVNTNAVLFNYLNDLACFEVNIHIET